jgi:hypothetical protein
VTASNHGRRWANSLSKNAVVAFFNFAIRAMSQPVEFFNRLLNGNAVAAN